MEFRVVQGCEFIPQFKKNYADIQPKCLNIGLTNRKKPLFSLPNLTVYALFMKGILILCFLALHTLSMSQVSGIVVSGDSKQPAVGARVTASDGLVTATDPDGKFKLNCKSFPLTLITKLNTFYSDTTVVTAAGEVTIVLKPIVQEIGDMVVTASRRQQDVEEVAVSMEIIKPSLIESKGFILWKRGTKPRHSSPAG